MINSTFRPIDELHQENHYNERKLINKNIYIWKKEKELFNLV